MPKRDPREMEKLHLGAGSAQLCAQRTTPPVLSAINVHMLMNMQEGKAAG